MSLVVPDEYARRFDDLRRYLATEMEAVGDESTGQELSLLATLYQSDTEKSEEVSE